MKHTNHKKPESYHKKADCTIIRCAGIILVTGLLYIFSAPQEMQALQPDPLNPGLHAINNNTEPVPDTIVTCKLTVTGGGIPLPPKPPFPPVTVITCPLNITGGGTPPPPKPPFPGVTITTPRLTITGLSK